jgi:hypothetical protein
MSTFLQPFIYTSIFSPFFYIIFFRLFLFQFTELRWHGKHPDTLHSPEKAELVIPRGTYAVIVLYLLLRVWGVTRNPRSTVHPSAYCFLCTLLEFS